MSFNKYLYKKIIAAATALTMAFAATGCGESTSWVAKCSDMTVNSGIYIFYQTQAYSEATSILKKDNEDLDISDVKLLKTMSVENTNITEWINNKAEKQLKIFMAVNQKFDELGLELSADAKNEISTTADLYWQYYSSQYELNGIGQDSFRQLVEFDYKKEQVFLHYYGEGGEKECSDAEIGAYLEGNYARVKNIKFDFLASDGSTLSDDEKKELKKMAEDYKKRADKGESFDSLIDEYQAYLDKLAEEAEAAAAEEEAAEDADAEEGAVTTAPVTEAPAETTAEDEEETSEDDQTEESEESEEAEDEESEDSEGTEDEEESEDEESDEDSEEESEDGEEAVTTAPETSEKPEETTAADAEDDASDSEESDEEESPYKNETIYKKGSEEDGFNPSETVNNAVFNDCFVNGDAVIIEDEENNCMYLVQRLDILQRKDFFEGDQKTTVLTEMFEDEFETMAVEWADAYSVNFNAAAIKRYDPFNIKM